MSSIVNTLTAEERLRYIPVLLQSRIDVARADNLSTADKEELGLMLHCLINVLAEDFFEDEVD